MEGSPISTGIIASMLYTRLYGVSLVEDWGVHLYAHNTSMSSSGHFPFAVSSLFFNWLRMTLFAASAWLLVCGCSTELVMCWMLRSW